MPKDDWETLSKLVALKRSKAEQAYASAKHALVGLTKQLALTDAEKRLVQLREEMSRDVPVGMSFEAVSLAEKNGNSRRLAGLVDVQKEAILACRAEADARRETLKLAFGAEQRVKDIRAGRK